MRQDLCGLVDYALSVRVEYGDSSPGNHATALWADLLGTLIT